MKTRMKPSMFELVQFVLDIPRTVIVRIACLSFDLFYTYFRIVSPRFLEHAGRIKARAAYYRAIALVPAYKRFVVSQTPVPDEMPETDKDNYIRQYSTEERCIGGRLPVHGTMIDESSGSTGIPYNWVRSTKERSESHRSISYFASYCYGKGPWITINAFSMGAWATGINMGIALQRNSIVKNTGPDVDKILHTLGFFGKSYTYLIAGYPPFLKRLIDEANARQFPLKEYRLHGMVGGEGMSEGLRDYISTAFQSVYSGYGATDLEIGMAGETPIAVAIRRLAAGNEKIRRRLFGTDTRLPMMFQYNPLMHHMEVNANGELICTINRKTILSPRIRYNVHDQGGIMRFDTMMKLLNEMGVNIDSLNGISMDRLIKLPFMWVYGRRDYTVSVMGANIYPEDIEHCLYDDPALAAITRSFCLTLTEEKNGGVRPCFMFELNTTSDDQLIAQFRDSMLQGMIALNNDFREAYRENQEALIPDIKLFGAGEGPFAKDSHTIKQVRIINQSRQERL